MYAVILNKLYKCINICTKSLRVAEVFCIVCPGFYTKTGFGLKVISVGPLQVTRILQEGDRINSVPRASGEAQEPMIMWSSNKACVVDALAARGDEGRCRLR